jgi:RHS repeat-associated protein
VTEAREYYPFGMVMPNRKTPAAGNSGYRYGFNGKENDDEAYGDDNQQDYGMRVYDPRVGRFLSVDPIAAEYPELTSYQFASNTPIQAVDLDGLEKYYAADGTYINAVGADTEIRVVTDENLSKAKQYIDYAIFDQSQGQKRAAELKWNTQKAKEFSSSLKDYASEKGDVTNGAQVQTYADNNENCYDAAVAQMADAGITPLGKYDAIQTDVNNSIQPADDQLTENKIGGAIYIITEIKKGNPVMVGLKETRASDGSVVDVGNKNRNTGHFVVINAISHNGQYIDFKYIDNASKSCATNDGNRLNLGLTTGRLVDGSDPCVIGAQEYEVSEVRKNR